MNWDEIFSLLKDCIKKMDNHTIVEFSKELTNVNTFLIEELKQRQNKIVNK